MNRDLSGASPKRGNDPEPVKAGRRKITRRQFLARGTATLFGAGLLTGGYVWQGEPGWLEVTELELPLAQLPPLFRVPGWCISAMSIWVSIKMPGM